MPLPEWVNVHQGGGALTAPRLAHLVEPPGSYQARCGFAFAPEDVARRARYPRCPRCAELDPRPGAGLAFSTEPGPGMNHHWIIVRSNLHDWAIYRDGALWRVAPSLAEVARILSDYGEAAP